MVYFFCLHAEILILQGRPEDAWRALDEGLRLAQARGVSIWLEELYRLQGEILLHAQGQEALGEEAGPAAAERRFQTALELARRHDSRFLEQRAALSLGRLWQSQGRTQEARELVGSSLQCTSGLESRDLLEARAFLEACAAEEKEI